MKTFLAIFCLLSFFRTYAQDKRDILRINSTDGRTIEAELISADHSSVTFKRLESSTPFTVQLSTLKPATVQAIRSWTTGFRDRTPPSFKQFHLGMAPEHLTDKPIPNARVTLVQSKPAGDWLENLYVFERTIHPHPDPSFLASVDGQQFYCGQIQVIYYQKKAVVITIFSPYSNESKARDWFTGMLAVLTEKYGPSEKNKDTHLWQYSLPYAISLDTIITEKPYSSDPEKDPKNDRSAFRLVDLKAMAEFLKNFKQEDSKKGPSIQSGF